MQRNWLRIFGTGLLLAAVVAWTGCSNEPEKKSNEDNGENSAQNGNGDNGHSHERGKMLIADAGKYHALLTAHLSSKTGNELDIFFETADDEAKPVPLPVKSFTAKATTGDGGVHDLTFTPAPPDEDPKGEQEGTRSHFVAEAHWMKEDDSLLVIATVEIDGEDAEIRWKNFNPKKYAHHVE